MSIGRLAFVLAPGGAGAKAAFTIQIDGREFVTGCFLADDLANLVRRFPEIAEEGRRFDLFFSNASPYSVSVSLRGGELYLRISDSFDGGVLEDRVSFISLWAALVGLIEAVLRSSGLDAPARQELAKGLAALKDWRGPVTGG